MLTIKYFLVSFYLNTAILFIELAIYFFLIENALVLFCQCATMPWQCTGPDSNMHDTLQQTEYFQHSSFPSEDLADDRGTSIVVGTCQFHRTPNGNQLLAANMPGALPAHQLPMVGKLPGFPPGRWASCQLLTLQLQKKNVFQGKNSTFLNFSAIFKIPDQTSMSNFQLSRNCRGTTTPVWSQLLLRALVTQ